MLKESTLPSASRGIASWDVWATARLGLYGMGDDELEALIVQHRGEPSSTDRVTAAAARHVVGLRRGMAAGKSC